MKEIYRKPISEINIFSAEDCIVTSSVDTSGDNDVVWGN